MNPTSGEFTEEQKQYLQGFAVGIEIARSRQGLATFAGTLAANGAAPAPAAVPVAEGPDGALHRAQDRFLAEGRKLTPEETARRKKHPLDMWEDLEQHAKEGRFPKGTDVLAFKYHGLFYVAPAQDSYMCRMRFAGGLITSAQFRRVAEAAETWGGGYADVTTRANLQIREIGAADGPALLTSLQEAGIVPRGSGADNLRNITGTPTAGVDPQELIDVRPLCREMHHAILNRREMYQLPRKFNIAFDGGGTVSALADTNDIGFVAVRAGEGKGVPAGVYFRMELGGITGHLDFAKDSGLLLRAEECVPAALAAVRVFIDHGDRTDRKKARLKYLLDAWGHEKFVEETVKRLPFTPLRLGRGECEPRGPVSRNAHAGIHPQLQDGLFYVGVVPPVGRLRVEQMRGLARLADLYGTGDLRLTVWQNLLIPNIAGEHLETVKRELRSLELPWEVNAVRAGLVACTGNRGCRFAAADTKGHAMEIDRYLEGRVVLDQPINIHLTGCPHSCAQHYIGDIGLLGTQVEIGEDMVEGYHVFVAGGYGEHQGVGRELYRGVPATEVPQLIERMLLAYLRQRRDPDESFLDFTRAHSAERLQELFAVRAEENALVGGRA